MAIVVELAPCSKERCPDALTTKLGFIRIAELNQERRLMIRVVDVSHHYGVRPVLSHVSLDVPARRLVVLMGPNGVGKSTLLSIVAGLIAPARGYVEINGLRRRSSEGAELEIRKQIAFLSDQP